MALTLIILFNFIIFFLLRISGKKDVKLWEVVTTAVLDRFTKVSDNRLLKFAIQSIWVFLGAYALGMSFANAKVAVSNGQPILASFFFQWGEIEPNLFYVSVVATVVLVLGKLGLDKIHRKPLEPLTLLNMPGLTNHNAKANHIFEPIGREGQEILLETDCDQTTMANLTKQSLKSIIKQIQDKVSEFSNKDGIKCFTGMAPIPFIIYAGTKHKRNDISYYLEYSRSGSKYLALNNNQTYPALQLTPITTTDGSEAVIAFATTADITEVNIQQFRCHVFRAELCETCNNAIFSLPQLYDYVDTLLIYIENIHKQNPNLIRIHLLCSTQTCFAYHLGTKLVNMSNRLPQLVSWHFISSHQPVYTVGLIITGSEAGQIVKPS